MGQTSDESLYRFKLAECYSAVPVRIKFGRR